MGIINRYFIIYGIIEIRVLRKELHMYSVRTKYEHITIDERGVPFIVGTSMKVIELVSEKIAYEWSPEELYL